MIGMAMEPIFEIVRHRFWQFASFPFRPLCHGGSGGRKRGDRIRGRVIHRTVGEGTGLSSTPRRRLPFVVCPCHEAAPTAHSLSKSDLTASPKREGLSWADTIGGLDIFFHFCPTPNTSTQDAWPQTTAVGRHRLKLSLMESTVDRIEGLGDFATSALYTKICGCQCIGGVGMVVSGETNLTYWSEVLFETEKTFFTPSSNPR